MFRGCAVTTMYSTKPSRSRFYLRGMTRDNDEAEVPRITPISVTLRFEPHASLTLGPQPDAEVHWAGLSVETYLIVNQTFHVILLCITGCGTDIYFFPT